MFDAQLIAATLQSRAAWEILAPHITKDDMTPLAGFWYEAVAEWYAHDHMAQRIDKSLLVAQGRKRIKNPKHEEALLGFMDDLPEAPSPSNVAQIVLELKRHNVGMELAAAIAAQDSKRVGKLYREFGELQAATTLKSRSSFEDAVEWDKLDEVVGDDKRIPLSPKLLNERCNGGALPGHHILIFGRPEVGKSTFVINMTRGFLKSGQRVLYVGNEDNINVLKRRMRCRLTLMTEEEIKADPTGANKLAEQREKENGGALFMRHIHRGTDADLDRAIEDFEPTVLVYDQLRNHDGSGDKMTQKLETVAITHRSRLSRYGLVGVSVTQANDRTERYGQEPPEWLGMADVDSSRTGLPAQADLMIGIGAKQEHLQRNERCISIPKNKLSSDVKSKRGFVVSYDLHRSVVK
jgi:KaiC/GvpD/RAD55 family RecA-like ATPase